MTPTNDPAETAETPRSIDEFLRRRAASGGRPLGEADRATVRAPGDFSRLLGQLTELFQAMRTSHARVEDRLSYLTGELAILSTTVQELRTEIALGAPLPEPPTDRWEKLQAESLRIIDTRIRHVDRQVTIVLAIAVLLAIFAVGVVLTR